MRDKTVKIRSVRLILLYLAVLLLAVPSVRVDAADASAKVKALLDLRPGEWRELPNTKMDSVFPKRDKTIWGSTGPASVLIAWGGAAYDTKRNAFVFNGGGHGDYGGNEVYAFFLDELRWERLTEPSPVKKLDSGQYVTTDGTPISAHTYDGLEYLPNVDRVFRWGGAEWLSGHNFDLSVWLFDMSKRRWERKAAGGGGFPVSAFDPVRGVVYVITNSNVDEYDPVRDSWARRLAGQADFLPSVGAFDPENRKLITNSYQPGVIVYDVGPSGSVGGRTLARTQGAVEWDKAMTALEYDPVRKILVAWNGDRGTAYFDSKTLLWRRLPNAESPAAPVRTRERDYNASGAIYGRWRYVPKYDVFIGYNNPHANIWVWKPAAVATADAKAPAAPPPPVVKPLLDGLKTGSTVIIPPGVYREAGAITASNVTIKANGVRLEGAAHDGKAALVIQGNNVTIEGLECAGISVGDGNGGCIRLEAKDLTLRKVRFRDSQTGLMSWNRDSGTVLIEDSHFERLGRAHGVYIGRSPGHLIIRNSRFLSSRDEGHEIKSRAAKNTIENSVVASLDGIDSRLIDLPEGGENVIRRNVLAKGPASSNQDLIGVGLEAKGAVHSRNSTIIEDNIIIMERTGSNVLVHDRDVPPSRVERNKVIGGKSPGGSNTWFPHRAAAGLGPYPGLPDPR